MTRRFGTMTMAVGSAALAVAALVTIPTAASAAPEDTSLAGLEYVALGDSYSAGYGLTPLTGLPVAGCAQAAVDYPHQLAAAYGLELTDVTCAGAWATNMTEPQVTPSGTADPQVAVLSESTDIVTVTLGGNDLGFSTISEYCLALGPTGPVPLAGGNDCESYWTQPSRDLSTRIQTTVTQDIRDGLNAIKQAAPNAKVFVVGYPAIAPDAANTPTDGCFRPAVDQNTGDFLPDAFPFTDADTPYLHDIEEQLDDVVQAEAAAAGFTYVPTFDATLPHSACASDAEQFVEGITLSDASGSLAAVPGSLHPNATGVAYIASQLAPLFEAAFPAPTPTPTPTPTPSATTAAATAATLANTGSDPALPLGLGAGALLLGGLAVVGALLRRSRTAR